jgi:hypothetical protein
MTNLMIFAEIHRLATFAGKGKAAPKTTRWRLAGKGIDVPGVGIAHAAWLGGWIGGHRVCVDIILTGLKRSDAQTAEKRHKKTASALALAVLGG